MLSGLSGLGKVVANSVATHFNDVFKALKTPFHAQVKLGGTKKNGHAKYNVSFRRTTADHVEGYKNIYSVSEGSISEWLKAERGIKSLTALKDNDLVYSLDLWDKHKNKVIAGKKLKVSKAKANAKAKANKLINGKYFSYHEGQYDVVLYSVSSKGIETALKQMGFKKGKRNKRKVWVGESTVGNMRFIKQLVKEIPSMPKAKPAEIRVTTGRMTVKKVSKRKQAKDVRFAKTNDDKLYKKPAKKATAPKPKATKKPVSKAMARIQAMKKKNGR